MRERKSRTKIFTATKINKLYCSKFNVHEKEFTTTPQSLKILLIKSEENV